MSMDFFRKTILPPLTNLNHKGSSGRVLIVGGSPEYSGAPFFAAIASLRSGADLSTVVTIPEAAVAIKSLSPDIITLPFLPSKIEEIQQKLQIMSSSLARVHAVGIGPGLSRSSVALETAAAIISMVKDRNIPIVLDADALFLISNQPKIIHGYRKAILTPNANEFKILCNTFSIPVSDARAGHILSECLGGVTIVQKGAIDVIYQLSESASCAEYGSPRRCGGQGDLLVGVLCTFLAWSDNTVFNSISASLAACSLIRKANELAYVDHKRSMITSDILKFIPEAMAFFHFS